MQSVKWEYKYAKHRNRVDKAKAIIDHKSPKFHTGNFARFSNLKQDMQTYFLHYKDNVRLLASLNCTLRTKGVLDTFRICNAAAKSQIPRVLRELKSLDKLNFKFGKRVICAKTDMFARHPYYVKFRENRPKINYVPPMEVLEKYKNLKLPKDDYLLRKLLRPTIWLNLEVKGYRPLGPIVIQLYTEAAPQVVLEFVRMAIAKDRERIHFSRLFAGLWVDGELFLDDDEIISKQIEYDYRALDHGERSGILSFSLKNMGTCKEPCLKFAISFKRLRVLNGARIGFGHVTRGHKTLNCLGDYATKNGKPTKEIFVASCGAYY